MLVDLVGGVLGGAVDVSQLGCRGGQVGVPDGVAGVFPLRLEQRRADQLLLQRIVDGVQRVEHLAEGVTGNRAALGEPLRHLVGVESERGERLRCRLRAVDRGDRELFERVGGHVGVTDAALNHLGDQAERVLPGQPDVAELRSVLLQRVDQVAGDVQAFLAGRHDQIQRLGGRVGHTGANEVAHTAGDRLGVLPHHRRHRLDLLDDLLNVGLGGVGVDQPALHRELHHAEVLLDRRAPRLRVRLRRSGAVAGHRGLVDAHLRREDVFHLQRRHAELDLLHQLLAGDEAEGGGGGQRQTDRPG